MDDETKDARAKRDPLTLKAEALLREVAESTERVMALSRESQAHAAEVRRLEDEAKQARAAHDRLAWSFMAGLIEKLHARAVTNRSNASRPRRRSVSADKQLVRRALSLAVDELSPSEPDAFGERRFSASDLYDRLQADGCITFDDDDLELSASPESVVVRDLSTDRRVVIPVRGDDRFAGLRQRMSDASRNRNS